MSDSTFLQAALRYAALGYRVFPCKPRGKKPLTTHGCKDATTDAKTIQSWWQRWPNANVGIACEGVLVIDVDPLDDGSVNPWLNVEPGASLRYADGPLAVTPRGGRHFWFRAPKNVTLKPGTSQIAEHVDHRVGAGSYVVVPPSIGENGSAYAWEMPLDCEADKLPPAPEDIITILVTPKTAHRKSQQEKVRHQDGHLRNSQTFAEGSRNDHLTREAGRLRRAGCDVQVIDATLQEINQQQCAPPLDTDEVRKIAESVSRYPIGSASTIPATPADWPEPQALPDDLPAVMPFDFNLLPDAFRPWIEDIAERVQCPPDFSAVTAMVGLASIVGRKVGIRPKRQDDWIVVPNLWGAVVGRPSLMKTPAIEQALKPLKKLEIEAVEKFREAQRELFAAKIVSDAKFKVAKENVKAALKNGEDATKLANAAVQGESAEPIRKRYLVNDTTVEKLGVLLNENPNGVLVFRDELVGLLKSLDKEGQEGARAFYLEAWAGNGRYTFDRIGRGTLDIEAACVSIIGGIQPGPLEAYQRDAMRGGGGDDGLIQRFQLAVWPDSPTEWRNVDRWPDSEAREAAWEVFRRLDQQTADDLGAEHDKFDSSEIPFLRFSSITAQDQFDEWRTNLERRLRGQEHPAIEAHLAKYRSLVPSLALLIHLADTRGGLVGAESLDKAIRWATYLESHARRLYGAAVMPDVSAAKALAQRIKRNDVQDGFTLRDVYRNGWSNLTTKEDAERAAAVLVDFDWLRSDRQQTGGCPRMTYFINPKISGTRPTTN